MTVVDLVVIGIAVSIGAAAKSVTGLGLPLVGVPVMASVFGVERAVVVMALPTFVSNTWLLWEHRSFRDRTRHLPVILALGATGTVAGTVLLVHAHPPWLAATLAALLFAYLALRALRPAFRLSPTASAWTAPGVGLAAGLLQGATGVSSPVVATYMHGLGLHRRAFVLSITAVFQVYALIQIATFAALGRYTPGRVLESVLSLVPVVVIFPLGVRLARRIHGRRFEQLVLVLLAVTGGKLALDALAAL